MEKGSVKTMDFTALWTGTESSGLRRICACLVALAAMCTAALLLQEPAHAGDSYTWTGGGDGESWTDVNNWGGQKYPGQENSDDSATISRLPDGNPSPVKLGESITLGSLDLSEGASVTGGSLTLNEGLNWTGGNLTTNVTMESGSSGTIVGADPETLNGTKLD
ncbi:MAG: hypothetical protein M3151_09565, partial [Actinomycetota bacterium]|nr:hypothetical protein [Actinomycetota bacterium]